MTLLQQWTHRVFQRLRTGTKPGGLREMIHVLPKDAIMAIDNPVFVCAKEAAVTMTENEQVIGLRVDGDVRAYPVNILSVHEIVNDVVGGTPVAITWCPLSYSAVVYKRMVIDRALSFGVSGGILRNTLVMYDRETESLWNHLRGDAFSGALSGISLQSLPATLTRWGSWQQSYPDTFVLSKEASPYHHYEEDHMVSYYASEKTGIRPPARQDHRLNPKDIVYGIQNGDSYVVYPFSLLAQVGVVHDSIDSRGMVVFFDQSAQAARAFWSQTDGFTLCFYQQGGTIYDSQTNSIWTPDGRCVSGLLSNRKLVHIAGIPAFWFAWIDHYPNSVVFQMPQPN